jgi:hypothetical protein
MKGKEKERIAAQKVLKEIIGPKPESAEDPKRMEKNVFYIQLNNNQTTVNIPLEKLKGLTQEEVRTIVQLFRIFAFRVEKKVLSHRRANLKT